MTRMRTAAGRLTPLRYKESRFISRLSVSGRLSSGSGRIRNFSATTRILVNNSAWPQETLVILQRGLAVVDRPS
jgi:hypothetical protein